MYACVSCSSGRFRLTCYVMVTLPLYATTIPVSWRSIAGNCCFAASCLYDPALFAPRRGMRQDAFASINASSAQQQMPSVSGAAVICCTVLDVRRTAVVVLIPEAR